jgi:hypothetical protein
MIRTTLEWMRKLFKGQRTHEVRQRKYKEHRLDPFQAYLTGKARKKAKRKRRQLMAVQAAMRAERKEPVK